MSSAVGPALISAHQEARIWLLEADSALFRLLADRFRACGWKVIPFLRVEELLESWEHDDADLLLLDVSLPATSCLQRLSRVRPEREVCPVLILSADASPRQRIEALASGANDVMIKPFHFKELAWRIERLLQASLALRIRTPAVGVINAGPLTLDTIHNCLRADGGIGVPISRGDRALLMPLLQAPGVVISRERLAQACGSLVDVASSRTLDVRLSRLRRRLRQLSGDAVSIEAVRRAGYRLMLLSCGPPLPETSVREHF